MHGPRAPVLIRQNVLGRDGKFKRGRDMGAFVDGIWRDGDFPHDTTGRFVRPDSPFRNWVTASGEAGPSGVGGFKAEAGRYPLIVSLACPWAHRTLIFRRLKGLESMISLSAVHWLLA